MRSGVVTTILILKVKKSVMSFFSKFVEYVLPNLSQTGVSTTVQCSPADIDDPLAPTTDIFMENQPQTPAVTTPQPLDAYWTTPYGDFAIRKTRFGLYQSYDRELVGLVTGGTYDAVWQMTPCHLQWAREGYNAPEGKPERTYDGVVGGKL